MSKKTRKEKIIAGYRKKLQFFQQQKNLQTDIDKPIPIIQSEQKKIEIEEKFAPIEEDLTTKKYFLRDFKKSIGLIVIIIALEIVFYFVRIKGY